MLKTEPRFFFKNNKSLKKKKLSNKKQFQANYIQYFNTNSYKKFGQLSIYKLNTRNSDIIIFLMQGSININTEGSNSVYQSKEFNKRLIQQTIPSEQSKQKSNFLADQFIWLLNEPIQNKIYWEHEKLLFWESQEEDLNKENYQKEIQIGAIKSSQSFQLFCLENQKKANQFKQELKTPELCALSQSPGLIKMVLQLSTNDIKKINKTNCSCKKSECLKMYCECFRSGKQCQDCRCIGCKNNSEMEQQRLNAIRLAKEKEPTAFLSSSQYKGCRCTKNKCLKGYCDCFLNGLICGKYCKCMDCQNCTQAQLRRTKKKEESKK